MCVSMCVKSVCFVCFSSHYNLKNISQCMHSCVSQVRLLCFPLKNKETHVGKAKQVFFSA